MDDMFTKGTVILSRGGKLKGVATGSQHKCMLEGCRGVRVAVKWPDGKHTFPCSEGIIAKGGKWRIG